LLNSDVISGETSSLAQTGAAKSRAIEASETANNFFMFLNDG